MAGRWRYHLYSSFFTLANKHSRSIELKIQAGDNKAVLKIYENMIDSLVSDQFSIMAVSTSDANHVGIKYDESDSGSAGAWINVYHCK